MIDQSVQPLKFFVNIIVLVKKILNRQFNAMPDCQIINKFATLSLKVTETILMKLKSIFFILFTCPSAPSGE